MAELESTESEPSSDELAEQLARVTAERDRYRAEAARHLVTQQELALAKAQVDAELQRFDAIQRYIGSALAIPIDDREAFIELTLEAVIETFELEVAVLLQGGGAAGTFRVAGEFGMPEVPETVDVDTSELAIGVSRILRQDDDPTGLLAGLDLVQGVVCAFENRDGALAGLLFTGLTADGAEYFSPVEEERCSAFTVMTRLVGSIWISRQLQYEILAHAARLAALTESSSPRGGDGRPAGDRPRLDSGAGRAAAGDPLLTRRGKLLLSLLLLAALALPFAFWGDLVRWLGGDVLAGSLDTLRLLIGILLWLLLAYVVDSLIHVLVWEGVVESRLGAPVPRLLRNVVSTLIYLAALGGIAGGIFGQDLTILLAATGGAGIVIGFALQTLISDFFSGIVLSIQRPFKQGDWVCLDGEWGRVQEINWHSTQIVDPSDQLITFPNSQVAGMKVINTSHRGHIRQVLWVTLDYEVPVEQAVRILRAGARAGQLEVGDREPVVEPLKMEEEGIGYRIRFWMPDLETWFESYGRIIAALQRHLHLAGLRYSRPIKETPSSRRIADRMEPREHRLELLRATALFGSLDDEKMTFLESRLVERRFAAGDDVVVQGEPGDSMFLIAEGVLDVRVFFKDEDREVKVASLDVANFLGEISVLTGEPRTATVRANGDAVLYEITHDVLERLFGWRPDLVDELSQVMAERRMNVLLAKQQLSEQQAEAEKASLARQILGKIKGFFSTERAAFQPE